MKILHVTPSFYPAFVYGGPTISVYNLCCGLARNGCFVRVLTTDANGPDSELNVDTSNEVELTTSLRVRYCHRLADVAVSPALLTLLPAYVRAADVVHVTSVYSFPTIPTLTLCRLMKKPVIWSPRGMLQRWPGTRRTKLKYIWEQLCHIVSPEGLVLHVTSDREASESVTRMPKAKPFVIPNGVVIPQQVINNGNLNEFRFVFLGRIDPKKGLENLIQAYKSIRRSLPMNSSLTIAGDGTDIYKESLKQLIQRLDLSLYVRMIGSVTGESKTLLLENSDVVIVPSYTENFGLVVAEALAYRVPVIASFGTPWSRLDQIGCGLWVDNTPEELALAMRKIVHMPLADMGRRGREWMIREFSWDLVAKQMSDLYRNMVASA